MDVIIILVWPTNAMAGDHNTKQIKKHCKNCIKKVKKIDISRLTDLSNVIKLSIKSIIILTYTYEGCRSNSPGAGGPPIIFSSVGAYGGGCSDIFYRKKQETAE